MPVVVYDKGPSNLGMNVKPRTQDTPSSYCPMISSQHKGFLGTNLLMVNVELFLNTQEWPETSEPTEEHLSVPGC